MVAQNKSDGANGPHAQARKLPQYLAALSVCLGSVAAGTVLGWTGNTGSTLKKGELNSIEMDDDILGWLGSFANLGALAMCIPIGYICDRIGRKLTMLLSIIPFLVGWLLIIFADSIGMVYAGRFLTGTGGGVFCVAAPLYTSEIAQTEIRGTLGSYFQLLLTVGIFISYVVGAYTTPKVLSIICAIVPLVFGVVFFFQPETPVYCLKKGRESEARTSLRRLRGPDYDIEPEINELKHQIEMSANNTNSFKSFKNALGTNAAKKSLICCFALMFFQQLSGINAVIFYVGTIFEESDSGLPASDATIIVGAIQIISTLVSSLTIERFGRKILLIISDVFMCISAILLGIFFMLKQRELITEEQIKSIGFLPVLSLCIFIIMFSMGFGPIPWMISSELMPTDIKSIASSAASLFNWFLAFIVTKFYLDLTHAIKTDVTFYIFAIISSFGALFVFFYVPETKGKTLEQIQNELSGRPVRVKEGIENEAYGDSA